MAAVCRVGEEVDDLPLGLRCDPLPVTIETDLKDAPLFKPADPPV